LQDDFHAGASPTPCSRPTRIYVRSMLELLAQVPVKGSRTSPAVA